MPPDRQRPRRWSWLVGGLALVGALVLICLVIFVVRLDIFGRIVADIILANATRPAGREMPATAGAIGYASADIQIIGGMGQGLSCSLPPIADTLAFPTGGQASPIGLRMRQACAYHDYCYRHGAATYGFTQADCDFALQAQAFRLCKFIERERKPDEFGHVQEGDCMRDARLVTLGVRIGGSDSFRTLDVRSVPANGETARGDTMRNSSTFFEFDPYATQAANYTVYRVADAPPDAGRPSGAKAIYSFQVRPSGTVVSYSTGLQPYRWYGNIPGHPGFQASAPFVVRAGSGADSAEWFVWWQRVSDDQTTGRLHAWAPGVRAEGESNQCPSLPGSCVLAELGKHKGHPDDPEFHQLRPADLGKAAADGLSLVTLRSHACIPGTNAPCYVHVVVKTGRGPARWQPQEPLSINDRLSPKPRSRDSDRYRNFASLPFVLDPPGDDAPVIAWTRRDIDYQNGARLRRAAVDAGPDKTDTKDNTSRSLGTVLLNGFRESDEPAFVLGRSSRDPIIASLSDSPDAMVAMRTWALPPPFDELKAARDETVDVKNRCDPKLEAAWLLRPPQILGRRDGTSLAVFSLLKPNVSADWTFATIQLATLVIQADGTCPKAATIDKKIDLQTTKPVGMDRADPIERGRNAFARVSRTPILLADLTGDGSLNVVLPEGSTAHVPQVLCTLRDDGRCPSAP